MVTPFPKGFKMHKSTLTSPKASTKYSLFHRKHVSLAISPRSQVYPEPLMEVKLAALIKNQRKATNNFKLFNNITDTLNLYLYRLFDSPKAGAAELLIDTSSDPELKCLITDLSELSNKNHSLNYLKQSLNTLLRQVGRFLQQRLSKEHSYILYLFILNLLQQVEAIYSYGALEFQNTTHSKVQPLTTPTKAFSEYSCEITTLETKYKDKLECLKQELFHAKVKIDTLEAELDKFRKKSEKVSYAAEVSPVMEGLETAYGKIKQALNETYSVQLHHMRQYLNITKDIAIKVKKGKATVATQTDLTLVPYFRCFRIETNVLSDPRLIQSGSALTSFIYQGMPMNVQKRPWRDMYEMSELILNSESSVSTVEIHQKLHVKCLSFFLTKFLDISLVIEQVYAYLMQIKECEESVVYAKYIGMLYGMNGYRTIKEYEGKMFEEKRWKLYAKLGYVSSVPKPNTKISIVEFIEFLKQEFDPTTVSMGLTDLYEGNRRSSAEALGYSITEFPSFLYRRLQEKMGDMSPAQYVSKIGFLMYIILAYNNNKDPSFNTRTLCEKEDKQLKGTVPIVFAKEAFGTQIADCDKEFIINSFTEIDKIFKYKEFFDILALFDVEKKGPCYVPLFVACYGILQCIMKTSDYVLANAPRVLASKITMGKASLTNYEDALTFFKSFPAGLNLTSYDFAAIYSHAKSQFGTVSTSNLCTSTTTYLLHKHNAAEPTKTLITLIAPKQKVAKTLPSKTDRKTPRPLIKSGSFTSGKGAQRKPMHPSLFSGATKTND